MSIPNQTPHPPSNRSILASYCESPIGLVEILGTESAICAVEFVEQRNPQAEPSPYLEEARLQIEQYFQGKRKEFELNLDWQGTPFQQSVWSQLLKVGYGHLASYQDIANGIGNPKAVRAVGAANGKNPIAIVVPCHRVIGSGGDLTGYASGVWRKEWLLKHEGALLV